MSFVIYDGYTVEMALASVGPGWSELVREVFAKLAEAEFKGIKIVQVKEKFAGLRIYSEPYNEDFYNFLLEIEDRSFDICETCGAPGKVRNAPWIFTACDEHSGGAKAFEGGFTEKLS